MGNELDDLYRDFGDRFYQAYAEQKAYNQKVKGVQKRSHEEWVQTYLLGLVSEVNEILKEMKWKLHRNSNNTHRSGENIAPELADLTKYVHSLWIQAGYGPHEILASIERKQEMLDQLWEQEFGDPPKGKDVILTDLDGTLADFRLGFYKWISASKWKDSLEIPEEDGPTLHMDVDYRWNYQEYEACKDEFECGGGYGRLPAIPWAVDSLRTAMRGHRAYVVAYTARPHDRVKRVWLDSWHWLKIHEIVPNELHMGSEDRVHYALSLRKRGNRVVLFEDNPSIAQRAASNDLVVVMPVHNYNKHLLEDPLDRIIPCGPTDLPDWSGLFDIAHGYNRLHEDFEVPRIRGERTKNVRRSDR